eukprot:3156242-Rhodomonas_salina.1
MEADRPPLRCYGGSSAGKRDGSEGGARPGRPERDPRRSRRTPAVSNPTLCSTLSPASTHVTATDYACSDRDTR